MKSAARRAAILQAAAPLIAQSGLHGASVRDIADAAGVSEALLYKHFPSKQAIYEESLAAAREFSGFTITRFETLEPSTESFVLLTYATVDFILFGAPGSPIDHRAMERLLFHSLLDDGAHARAVFADTAARWMDYVVKSYQAAVDARDIVELATPPAHRFRFVQQLAMALKLSHLPDPPAFEYTGTKRELADEAVLFALRGVGVADHAIGRYFNPGRLRVVLDSLFPKNSEKASRRKASVSRRM